MTTNNGDMARYVEAAKRAGWDDTDCDWSPCPEWEPEKGWTVIQNDEGLAFAVDPDGRPYSIDYREAAAAFMRELIAETVEVARQGNGAVEPFPLSLGVFGNWWQRWAKGGEG